MVRRRVRVSGEALLPRRIASRGRQRGTFGSSLAQGLLLLVLGVVLHAGGARGDGLRVAASGDYPPFSERTAGGDALGFDAEIARRFAADRGVPVVWTGFRWPELLADLAADRFDVAMSGVTVRPERSVAGRFSVPVAETGAVLLVAAARLDADVDLEQQLRALDRAGLKIAVNAGGHLERVARQHFARAELVPIADNAAVRQALAEARVDAVVTDTLEGPGWMQGLVDVAWLGPFTRDRKAYLLRPGDALLGEALDAWLLERERDGTLARLRAEWLGARGSGRPARPVAALLAAADERLALMPFVAEAKRRRGAAVVDPAREERVLAAAQRAVAAAADHARKSPPDPAAVRAFYRAQIDAAVAVQRTVLAGPASRGPAFDLVSDLRPALLRIGERMAFLLVRLPGEPPPPDLQREVGRALASHTLPDERIDAIARSIARLLEGSAEPTSGAPAP